MGSQLESIGPASARSDAQRWRPIGWIAAAASLGLLAPAVDAATLRLEAVGSVNTVAVNSDPGAAQLGFSAATGDSFVLNIVYESATAEVFGVGDPTYGGYAGAVVAAWATIGSTQIHIPVAPGLSGSIMSIFNDRPGSGDFADQISIEARNRGDAPTGPASRDLLSFGATEIGPAPPAALTSDALMLFNMSGFTNLSMGYLTGNTSGSSYVTATVQSATVSAVPLPAAGWLLMSALGGIGAFARRNRAV